MLDPRVRLLIGAMVLRGSEHVSAAQPTLKKLDKPVKEINAHVKKSVWFGFKCIGPRNSTLALTLSQK